MHPDASQLKHQAQLLTHQGRYGEAASLYTRYLAEHPEDAHAMALLAITLLNMQHTRAGRKTAERAVSTDPQEPLAHYALGMGVLTDLSRISPQFVPWLPSTWRHKQNKQAESKPLTSPRLREAETHLLEAIRLAPNEAFFHAQLAAIRLDDGPSPGVQEALDSGLAQDPEDILCHEYQTRLDLAQQDHPAALAASRRLLELEPNNKTAHALTARCLLEQNNPDTFTAIEHALNAARLDPTDDESRDVLLECFHRQHAIYRIPIRLAQKAHRFRSKWSPWHLAGFASIAFLFISIILAVTSAITANPNTMRYGFGGLIALIFLSAIGMLLPRHVATVLLCRDPQTRPVITKQSAVESSLLLAAAIYATAAAIIWWLTNLTEAGQLLLFSAACFIPALTALFCAAPGNDRRQMLMASLMLIAAWGGASAVVLLLKWPLAPVLYILPACLSVGMAAWVANREDGFE